MSKRRVPIAPGSAASMRQAHHVRRDAQVLHDVFGKQLLTAEHRNAVRRGLTTQRALQKIAGSNPSASLLVAVESELTRGAVRGLARTAGRAAGAGAVVDGCMGLVEASHGWHQGRLTAGEAAVHVARETATGAIASAVGVGVAATVVSLTGGLATPVVAAVALGASMSVRAVLRALTD